jgi:hypothetical protein
MSEAEEANLWKWNDFVEIGNKIKTMNKQVRILEAKKALGFAKQLIENEFILNLPVKDQKTYKDLLPKIAEYLDENAEEIQTAVKEYFLCQHFKAGLDHDLFDITFSAKKSGIQTGFTCIVRNGTQSVCYYIKTHQYGPTEGNLKSIQSPDTKELFVYKLLHLIGIGPEPHFIVPSHGTNKTIYIATKDCHLVLLSKLTKDTVNNDSLVQLDLISRILCLRDCTTNSSNCGQVNGKPMIVDFRIEKQSLGYIKEDILDKFYEGNSEFHYTGFMNIAMNTPNTAKRDIMKKSLDEWKLLENIDRAAFDIERLVQRWIDKLEFKNDLQRYVQDLKVTVELLMKS